MNAVAKNGSFSDMADDLPWDSTRTDAPKVSDANLPNGWVPGVEVTEDCRKCRGTGRFVGYSGMSLGPCFKCNGKGKITYRTSQEKRAKARARSAQKKIDTKASNLAAFAEAHPAEWNWMNGNSFGFAVSMISAIEKFGDLTVPQLEAVRRLIAKRDAAKVEAQARAANAPEISLAPVEAAFANAMNAGIKYPKLNLGAFQMKPAKAGGKNDGAIYVTEGGQ